jgi:hypothetical protein
MPAILIEELWMSHEELQRHLRLGRYREILLIVEMASETPEIRFDVISQSGGMETIAQARTLID